MTRSGLVGSRDVGSRFTQFGVQAGQFGLQGLVFLGLTGQVGAGAGQAVAQAGGGEPVGEFVELLPAALEGAELEVALGEQGLEQEVGVAEADAEGGGDLALVRWGSCCNRRRTRKWASWWWSGR